MILKLPVTIFVSFSFQEALRKLQDAEKSKQKLQEKINESKRERKKFLGNSLDMPDIYVSHRGPGAFPTPPHNNNHYSRSESLKDRSPIRPLDFRSAHDDLGSDSEKENVLDNSYEK